MAIKWKQKRWEHYVQQPIEIQVSRTQIPNYGPKFELNLNRNGDENRRSVLPVFIAGRGGRHANNRIQTVCKHKLII